MLKGFANRMVAAWKNHPLITTAFIVMAVVTLFLAVRLTFSVAYWSTHRNLPVEAWMPLGYIGRSYGIPVEEMRRIAGLPPAVRDRRPVGEIAASRGEDKEQFITRIEDGIARFKTARPLENGR